VQVTAVKNYGKNTGTSGRLIKAVYASYVCVHVSCTSQSGRLECTSLFVGLGGLGYEGAMSEKIVSKAVDEKGDGLLV